MPGQYLFYLGTSGAGASRIIPPAVQRVPGRRRRLLAASGSGRDGPQAISGEARSSDHQLSRSELPATGALFPTAFYDGSR